ncbi:hypothetical protein DSO57_1008359 [Entomophthora muscae]|uniref:Uncharacterized protein n=1 Tax=Entomophthora muscae TaxID=34485 RepID=A0ACC2S9H2_9FUNG|nr:hypothetical protein DSO57_1008359 [Entomophthora muscae]
MLSYSEALDCPRLGYEEAHGVDSEKLEMVEQAIAILESQKRKAMQDILFLQNKKKEILADPVAFIYKLRDGSEPHFPLPQTVTRIPENLTQLLPDESSGSSDSSDNESLSDVLERSPSPPVKKIWNKKDEQQLRKFLKVYSDEYSDEERFSLISKAMGNRSIEQVM